jgi:phosphinothricin acetyltransferase
MPAPRADTMLVRHADAEADADACAAIYQPFVSQGAVSFETVPPDRAEMARRIEQNASTHAWLVAESGGEVAGFAYGGPHRTRAAYRWATEVSVYVHADQRRRGVGRALYGKLLPLLARQGMQMALAGVTLPNDASVALHEAIGFEPVGVYRRIGWKQGAWHDVGWWQIQLPEPGAGPPPEPGPTPAPGPPPEPGPPARLDPG